jgi:hypothetical protein
MKKKSLISIFTILFLAGCANAPAVNNSASRIRLISKEEAMSCRFIRIVQYDDRIYALGKSATVMRAIGETGLRNEVASQAAGANAFVLKKDDSSWFLGTVAYQGEAFSCP